MKLVCHAAMPRLVTVCPDDFPVPSDCVYVSTDLLYNKDFLGFYYFDVGSGYFLFDTERWLSEWLRPKRDELLNEFDVTYTNAERWEMWNAEQRKAIRAYKKALKDFPLTANPTSLVWPVLAMPTT
jgi:hypothetical protein